MHGGLSTGPRTAAGLARSKRARWKHGRFSAEARQEMAHFRELLRECKEMEEMMNRQQSSGTEEAKLRIDTADGKAYWMVSM
jgi:hypothetical protein